MKRGYSREYMEQLFEQFRGFAHYGFPESHSASFALIAYASSWLKCHYPQAFCAALLNSQPMGFYAPHTLVADAKRHGVEVRPVDARCSDWDCTLEEGGALRLGLRMVRGLSEAAGRRVAAARGQGYASVGELARRARIARHELTRLALAGALASLCGSRRQALWEIQALGPLDEDDLFFGLPMDGTQVELPPMSVAERVEADFETVGLSLEKHPLELLAARAAQAGRGVRRGAQARGLGAARGGGRHAHHPAAASHRQGHVLHLAGGRDGHRQPGGAAGRLRALPPRHPRRPLHRGRGRAGAHRQGAQREDAAGDGAGGVAGVSVTN